jgi:multicomponent Na+:H+ antiporter subunit G
VILLDILTVVGLTLGTLVLMIAALGVARFPDFYTRLHAAGKGDTLGLALVLLGLMATAGSFLVSLKLAFIVFFVFILNPTATHALARGAWVCGVRPWRASDEPFLQREGQMSDRDRIDVVDDHTGGA